MRVLSVEHRCGHVSRMRYDGDISHVELAERGERLFAAFPRCVDCVVRQLDQGDVAALVSMTGGT